jgi:hypothetical protein
MSKEIANGWFNAAYILTPQELNAIRHATSVGLIVQMVYENGLRCTSFLRL